VRSKPFLTGTRSNEIEHQMGESLLKSQIIELM